MKRKYGWRPSLHDHNDTYSLPLIPQELPPLVDYRPMCTPVYDQGELGSCTANAISGAIQYLLNKETKPVVMPSRLFIYYNERAIEDTVYSDAGAAIKDGISVLATRGVCEETEWPYVPEKFSMKPPGFCYTDALKLRITQSQKLINGQDILKSTLFHGNVFVFGFSVYQNFESNQVASIGVLNYPATNEELLGGHAVCCVGYDDSKNAFIVRNSWGPSWGLNGYFYMSYDYVTSKLASDFWVIGAT